MLTLENITITVAGQTVVSNCSFTVNVGQLHVLTGQNGSGKSSLVHALCGHPEYVITQGTITCNEQNITHASPDERVKAGLFTVMQHAVAIPGLSILTFLYEVYRALGIQNMHAPEVQRAALAAFEIVGLDPALLYRDVHDGFSGGQKKRFELAQLLLFKPSVMLLDEIDSGLDAQGIDTVIHVIQMLRQANPQTTILLITHNQILIERLQPEQIYTLVSGNLLSSYIPSSSTAEAVL